MIPVGTVLVHCELGDPAYNILEEQEAFGVQAVYLKLHH